MSSITIHNDLLGIIFAYVGISQRAKCLSISRQCAKNCLSYQYIISLNANAIADFFAYCYRNNWVKLVAFCLKNPRIKFDDDVNCCLRYSSFYGYLKMVKLLLADPRVNPASARNTAIGIASQQGHFEVVKLLLKNPRVSPEDDDNYAIRHALRNGYLNIVKLLLADPRVSNSISQEKKHKYWELVGELKSLFDIE